MTDLRLSDDFQQVFDQRAKSPEGEKALDDFARLIIEWALNLMTPELLEVFSTREGMVELKKMWPEIVDGYFRHLSGPPSKKEKRSKSKTRKRSKQDIDAEHRRLLADHRAALERYEKTLDTPDFGVAAQELDATLVKLREFAGRAGR